MSLSLLLQDFHNLEPVKVDLHLQSYITIADFQSCISVEYEIMITLKTATESSFIILSVYFRNRNPKRSHR